MKGNIIIPDPIPASLRESLKQTQQLTESLKPVLDTQQQIKELVAPALSIASQLEYLNAPAIEAAMALNNAALKAMGQSMAEAFSIAPRLYLDAAAIEAAMTLNSAIHEAMGQSMANVVSAANEMAQSVLSAMNSVSLSWIHSINVSPWLSVFDTIIQGFHFNFEARKYNDLYLQEMYYAKWFPYAGWIANFNLAIEINDIISKTQRSKKRVKKIDAVILKYYTKKELNDMKRNWRGQDLPYPQMRMLHNAIQAYHRHEYALTVTVLMTMWESIIYDKTHDTSRKFGGKTKVNLAKLVKENAFDEIFESYFNEFIMYDCNSLEDVKEDVPGRHGIAHGWYRKYPSRKAALNAILFTDFLIGLKPLEDTEGEQNG